MKNKLIIITLLGISVLFTAVPALAYNEPAELGLEPLMTGKIQGTDTHFEIKDSEYLNISLQSSKEITIDLESVPRMISMDVSSSTDFTSTDLFINGLEPNTTYYKYEDSYKNKIVFISNKNGSYSFAQDLTQPHHIWIQPEKNAEIQSKGIQSLSGGDGVVFLPEECGTYGIWDEQTSTCSLTQDLIENIEITENNITFNSSIIANNVSEIFFGIDLYGSDNNRIFDNTILNNQFGIFIHTSDDNRIYHNNILNNHIQARSLYDTGNSFDNDYPSGGNYWSDYTGIDEKSGPNQDEPGSDNIGDTGYSFYHGIERRTDRYPFIEQSGWEGPNIQSGSDFG
jgi:parallel beta-helix repeat protein